MFGILKVIYGLLDYLQFIESFLSDFSRYVQVLKNDIYLPYQKTMNILSLVGGI